MKPDAVQKGAPAGVIRAGADPDGFAASDQGLDGMYVSSSHISVNSLQPGLTPIEPILPIDDSAPRRIPRVEASGIFAAKAPTSDRGNGRTGSSRQRGLIRRCIACRDGWPSTWASPLNSLSVLSNRMAAQVAEICGSGSMGEEV